MNEVHGILTSDQVHNATFASTHFKRGYDETEVDDFMDEVVRTLKHYENGGRPDSAPLTSTVVSESVSAPARSQSASEPAAHSAQASSSTDADASAAAPADQLANEPGLLTSPASSSASASAPASSGATSSVSLGNGQSPHSVDPTSEPTFHTDPTRDALSPSAPASERGGKSAIEGAAQLDSGTATVAVDDKAAASTTLPSPIRERGGHVVVAMADGRRTEEFGAVVENKGGGYQQVGKRLWRR